MIVIPMAGMSSRFFKAGFDKPKYMLEAHNKTLFQHAIESFKAYFSSEEFVFIVRDVFNTPEFVKQQALRCGIKNYKIVVLDQETRGQAETVTLGIEKLKIEVGSLTIFNIDTFRPNFIYPNLDILGDGFLEVFKGSGDNWSFVKPKFRNSTQIVQTTEKNPISNLCCTGLYHFSNVHDYLKAYYRYLNLPISKWEKGELYVAPLYNYLIAQGKDIHYSLIERNDVVFCGVPDEYYAFLQE